MGKFVRRISLFFLPLFLLMLAFEIIICNSESSYSVQKRQLEESADSIKILLMGPSYSYIGLDPSLFSFYAFNLSNNNQDIYYDVRLLEKYLPILKNLKLVVFNIGYQTFDHILDPDFPEERKREAFYREYIGSLERI